MSHFYKGSKFNNGIWGRQKRMDIRFNAEDKAGKGEEDEKGEDLGQEEGQIERGEGWM